MCSSDNNRSVEAVFTPYTRQLLQRAGWSPERRVQIDDAIRDLHAYGYRVHEKAQAFLTSFSDIVLDYRIATRYGNLRCVTHFSIARSLIHVDELASFHQPIGESFCIIGETDNQHITLVMGESGKVYGCNEDLLHSFGRNGTEAIEHIIRSDVERLGAR